MNRGLKLFLIFVWLIISILSLILVLHYNFNINIIYYLQTFTFKSSYLIPLILILILALFILIQKKYYENTLKEGKNCQVQFLRLEEIASTWLDKSEIEENIKNSLENDLKITENKMMNDLSEIVQLFLEKNIKNTKIVNELITPNIHMFSEKEIEIILTLLELLEKNQDVKSVASLNKDDDEIRTYKKQDVTQSENKYDILQNYTLLDHTLNVVRFIVDNLKHDHSDNFVFLLPKAIIVALAHDIGKIVNINVINGVENIDHTIYTKVPHEKISKMIMQSVFSDYESIEEICSAIEEHHIKNAESMYGLLLKKADHEARNYEVNKYLQQTRANATATQEVDSTTDELKEQISKLIEEKRLVEEKAKKDTLTRAYNRAYFNENIKKVYDIKKDTYHVAFVDADHFKKVNDTYGHQAGDEVLIMLVNKMYDSIRNEKNIDIFRYGGEEFCIVFKNYDNNKVDKILEFIRLNIEKNILKYNGEEIRITTSIGYADSKNVKDFNEIVKNSDDCVYKAKEAGRNKVIRYSADECNIPVIEEAKKETTQEVLKNLFDEPDIIKNEEYYFKYNEEMIGKLCETLAKEPNKVYTQKTSGRKKVVSITENGKIYIEDASFKTMLKKIGFGLKTEDDLQELFSELKKQTLLHKKSVHLSFDGLVNASKGFKIEFHAFNGESLGLSNKELDLSKRNLADLRNVKITDRG